ncbi:MAG: hypothetical protein QOK31_1989 [Solirubrobacteraceae bacterium]|jgi:hypothetical protein|nr:hypothetical protein [Solirubrobacteraceae bacterium]
MRGLLYRGSSAFVLLLIMFCGSLMLWIGIPVGWLWVGSQVQGSTGSVGAAIAAMLVGVVATVLAAIPVLGWLSNRYRAIRVARGLEDTGHFALEVVLVTSAGVAITGFSVWFFAFSGSSPFPVSIGF